MNMRMRIIGVISTVVLMSLATAGRVARADYVEASDFDFKTLLQPPPADNSDQWKAEIDQMLKLQAGRTDADVKRIESESKMTPFIFSTALGSWFNPDDLPVTAKFLTKVMKDSAEVVSTAKDDFQRIRPYKTDSRLHPCSDKEKSYSYPSSHSTRAVTITLVLSEILPDQKKAIMAEGMQIGDDRVLAGQHYPSDVAAGRILAKAIFDKMEQDPKFIKDLNEAKAECALKEPQAQAAK
jgi:acid phosphatase (class A)